jgi:PAS domain S-box-containing protein
MVLLDVIMETPDAGLRVARAVREELHNELVRIVLRTGQPGQALEHSIIVDYDINDFWCKADLTTRKLFTTVISSLRAYATLAAAAAERDALAAELARSQQLQNLVEQHALVLTVDAHGRILDVNEVLCQTLGKAREALVGHDLHALHPGTFPEPLATTLAAALAQEGNWAGDIPTVDAAGQALLLRCAVMSLKNAVGEPCQYLAVANVLTPC